MFVLNASTWKSENNLRDGSPSTIWFPPKDQTLGIALDSGYPNKALLMHWLVLINLFCIKPSTSPRPVLMSLFKMKGLKKKMKGLVPLLKIYLRLLPNRGQFMFTYTMRQGNLSMKLPASVCLFSNNNSSNKENLIARSPGRLYCCCCREAVAFTDLVNKDTQSVLVPKGTPPHHLHHSFNQTNFRNVSDSYVNMHTGI